MARFFNISLISAVLNEKNATDMHRKRNGKALKKGFHKQPMDLSVHFLTSALLTIVLWPFIGAYALWAIVGGFFIDADHFLWSVYATKSFSIRRSYNYYIEHRQRKDYERDLLHIFHTVEFWAFMILAAVLFYAGNSSFFFYMMVITFLGMVLHLTLDFTDLIRAERLDARAISWIRWMRRHRQ